MTYRAKMVNGEVQFEGGIKPADGLELRVEVTNRASEISQKSKGAKSKRPRGGRRKTVGQRMLRYAGIIPSDGLQTDGSLNVDHYVYGAPKR